MFLRNPKDWIGGSAKGPGPDDRPMSLVVDVNKLRDDNDDDKKEMQLVLKLDLRGDKSLSKEVIRKVGEIPGVTYLSLDIKEETLTVWGAVQLTEVLQILEDCSPTETIVLEATVKFEPNKESADEQPKKKYKKSVVEGELSVTGEKYTRSTEGSGASGSGINVRNLDDDWCSFREFLSNCQRPLSLSGCRAEDAIAFLRGRNTSGDSKALVSRRLSAACEVYGIKPKNNPFRSLAVITYLKMEREMTREAECVLVFSCHDKFDVDETNFTEAILKELHERELTPLSYNLSGRENLDVDMLYRSTVGIVVVSNCLAHSGQSLDHLVTVMEYWKAKDLVIIPVYLKVTPSDIVLRGLLEVGFPEFQSSIQADRVQKWKAALTETASIDGYQWSKGTQFMLAKKVVRNICLRLQLKNSKNLIRILALLNHPQPSEAEIVGIWGMAGIGKTSIATEVFEILAPQYDLCYFLQDFHLMCQRKGLRQMRDDFFSKVFGEEKLSIGACDTKPSFMRDLFHNKAILVVLDDVSNARDAEFVVGGFGWFSRGHRIILTSRRKQVLVQCKVKKPYEIQKLCEDESFRLCKQYLQEENAIISELMSCSSGIPLALRVLGSSVSKQHLNDMKKHLLSLRRNPPTKIQEAFQRSFDGLDENEKNIFLDLACFFRGENTWCKYLMLVGFLHIWESVSSLTSLSLAFWTIR